MIKKKVKSINSEEFFKLTSANSGVDLESTRHVFYGMVKTISRELKSRRIITLPDWGDFVLRTNKERRIGDVSNGGAPKVIPKRTSVKFDPDYKVRKYFHSLDD